MPPKKSPTLTEAELRLMEVLWQRPSATVHQLLDAMPQRALAYNSVLTTIRILEKKGYVQHIKDGRAHIYTALVGRDQATKFEIKNLVSRFFRNSHEALVLNLLEDKGIDAEELRRLKELLQQGEAAQ